MTDMDVAMSIVLITAFIVLTVHFRENEIVSTIFGLLAFLLAFAVLFFHFTY